MYTRVHKNSYMLFSELDGRGVGDTGRRNYSNTTSFTRSEGKKNPVFIIPLAFIPRGIKFSSFRSSVLMSVRLLVS